MADLTHRIAAAIARFVAEHGHAPAYVITHPDDGIACETVGATQFVHEKHVDRGEFMLIASGSLVDAVDALCGGLLDLKEAADALGYGPIDCAYDAHPLLANLMPAVREESRRFTEDMDAIEPMPGDQRGWSAP